MKKIYAIQPYGVGSNKTKSLAMVIPSEVIKRYDIDESSVFILNLNDSEDKRIVFDIITEMKRPKDMIPADKRFAPSYQQVSGKVH